MLVVLLNAGTLSSNIDPFADSVVLYLKGEDLTDSSPSPKSISTFGNAVVSSAQSKYGSSSLFSGTTGYFTVSDSSLNLASGSFTVESWVYMPSLVTSDILTTRSGSSQGGWLFRITSAPALAFFAQNDGWTDRPLAFSDSTWFHLAISYDHPSTTINVFSQGVLEYTSSSVSYVSTQSVVGIGAAIDGSNQADNLYVDHFRITKGVSRYSGNFNPETDTFMP